MNNTKYIVFGLNVDVSCDANISSSGSLFQYMYMWHLLLNANSVVAVGGPDNVWPFVKCVYSPCTAIT